MKYFDKISITMLIVFMGGMVSNSYRGIEGFGVTSATIKAYSSRGGVARRSGARISRPYFTNRPSRWEHNKRFETIFNIPASLRRITNVLGGEFYRERS